MQREMGVFCASITKTAFRRRRSILIMTKKVVEISGIEPLTS